MPLPPSFFAPRQPIRDLLRRQRRLVRNNRRRSSQPLSAVTSPAISRRPRPTRTAASVAAAIVRELGTPRRPASRVIRPPSPANRPPIPVNRTPTPAAGPPSPAAGPTSPTQTPPPFTPPASPCPTHTPSDYPSDWDYPDYIPLPLPTPRFPYNPRPYDFFTHDACRALILHYKIKEYDHFVDNPLHPKRHLEKLRRFVQDYRSGYLDYLDYP